MRLIQDGQSSSFGEIALRQAFSHSFTSEAADLFLRQLDAGLSWQSATQAVAEGTAERFGRRGESGSASYTVTNAAPVWIGLAFGLVLYLAFEPLLSVARELLVAVNAWVLHTFVASEVWRPVVSVFHLDPVYTGVAVRSLGNVEPEGVAVAGSVGDLMHRLFPVVFVASNRTLPGALSSMVATPGASVLGRSVAAFGADTLIILFGLALTTAARGSLWLAVFGLQVQAGIVLGHLLSLKTGARELELTGAPFALGLLHPTAGWWPTVQLARLPDAWQGAIVGSGLSVVAYAVAVVVLAAGRLASRLIRGRPHSAPTQRTTRSRHALILCMPLTVATVCSPVGRLAYSASNWQLVDQSGRLEVPNVQMDETSVQNLVYGEPHAVSLAQDASGNWRYLVDGNAEVIRGIGYNPQYAALPADERAQRYERDFSEIRSIGANTIEGWFENQFDEVTLDYAARNGLGVILPFELNQDWDYADPAVQADILSRISEWVVRYRANPAIRMWAPGNENLHRVLYPNWVSQEQMPQARARAQAFAAFLPRLVDRIHALDPDHPVLYRDAEDVYLGWLKQGFEHSSAPRPWFVYGTNVYSRGRLGEIIAHWPDQWLGGPLVVSEFAPSGRESAGRALGYQQDWQRIRAKPGVVLGGLAYAWATNGPEDLDRVFGLVDASGKPCDGALVALAAAYLNDPGPVGGSVMPAPTVVLGNG